MTVQAQRTITARYREQQAALRKETLRELLVLWPTLDVRRLDTTFPGWAVAVGRLVHNRRQTASTLAGAYLQAFRLATGVPGKAVVVPAERLPGEQLLTSLRVTSLATVKNLTAAGQPVRRASETALVRVAGAVSRLVLDAGRETVIASSNADPRAAGWQRVTSARACAFCTLLASRGAVYSEDTADFASHDHCGCSAEPVYDSGLI